MNARRFATVLALVLLVARASAGPRVLDIRAAPPPNPATGIAVFIASIEDARPHVDPEKKPDVIGIDFKGNEIRLPAPRTAHELFAEIVTKGFREAGFRVVERSDEEAAAVPVTVKVEEYWGHGKSGMVVYYSFDGVFIVQADLAGLREGARIEFHNTKGSWGANVGLRWRDNQQAGADELVRALRTQLNPATPLPASTGVPVLPASE